MCSIVFMQEGKQPTLKSLITTVESMNSYFLPYITYAREAMPFNKAGVNKSDIFLLSVLCKIVTQQKCEDIGKRSRPFWKVTIFLTQTTKPFVIRHTLYMLCPVSIIPLPFFRGRFAVPVSRCPVHRCRCRCVYLFAVCGCKGMEFSYVIFTEQRNFTTACRTAKRQRKNGIGMVETGH